MDYLKGILPFDNKTKTGTTVLSSFTFNKSGSTPVSAPSSTSATIDLDKAKAQVATKEKESSPNKIDDENPFLNADGEPWGSDDEDSQEEAYSPSEIAEEEENVEKSWKLVDNEDKGELDSEKVTKVLKNLSCHIL